MEKVKVYKDELKTKLLNNRDDHKDLVEKAKKGYLKAIKQELNRLLEKVEQGELINLQELYRFDQPVDKTEEYDTALQMLEMSVEDEIVLSRREFQNFVQDKWDWTDKMLFSNTRYI